MKGNRLFIFTFSDDMISIVMVTKELDRVDRIQKNISQTIEIPYEFIIIDNSLNDKSIFQAYNLGVIRSRFPIICFMHDDIVYHSKGWGKEVVRYFSQKNVGMIGVGGTRFLSSIPSSWWAGGHKYFSSKRGTICHNCIDTNRNNTNESKYTTINPEGTSYTKVVLVDGLWFCIPKELFGKIRFDEERYGGFHFYDLDISMQVKELNYDIICIHNIKVEHISASKHDKKWIENCKIFYDKWKASLPASAMRLTFKQLLTLEYFAIKIYRDYHISNKIAFSWRDLIKQISWINFLKFHFKSLITTYSTLFYV